MARSNDKNSKSKKPKNIGFFEAFRIISSGNPAGHLHNRAVSRGSHRGANFTNYSGMQDGRSY